MTVEESKLNRSFIVDGGREARDSWMRFAFAPVIECDHFVGVTAVCDRCVEQGGE